MGGEETRYEEEEKKSVLGKEELGGTESWKVEDVVE